MSTSMAPSQAIRLLRRVLRLRHILDFLDCLFSHFYSCHSSSDYRKAWKKVPIPDSSAKYEGKNEESSCAIRYKMGKLLRASADSACKPSQAGGATRAKPVPQQPSRCHLLLLRPLVHFRAPLCPGKTSNKPSRAVALHIPMSPLAAPAYRPCLLARLLPWSIPGCSALASPGSWSCCWREHGFCRWLPSIH
jgi:hypothetical protein